MNVRLAMAEAAREFSDVLKNRKFYEKVVRDTRWTEGPITIVGSGAARLAGLGAARAFEWLTGWPVAVRDVTAFGSYTLSALPPRSVLILVSSLGEEQDLLDVVRKAQRQGAKALALTRNAESSLGRMVHDVFLLPCADEAPPAVRTAFLRHATLLYISCIAARVFNPRHPLAGSWEEEFASLPSRLEWVQEHLGDAIESAASTLKRAQRTALIGGGLYYPAALQAARLARQLSGKQVHAVELDDVLDGAAGSAAEAAVVLSGSNCKVKKRLHAAATHLRVKNVQILSVTDGNDRHLVQASQLAILLPVLSEVTGSLLALAVGQWVMAESQG